MALIFTLKGTFTDCFSQFVIEMGRTDIRAVWRALLSCGFDVHFERYIYRLFLTICNRDGQNRYKGCLEGITFLWL